MEGRGHYFCHDISGVGRVKSRVLFCRATPLLVLWRDKMGFHCGLLAYLFIFSHAYCIYRRQTNKKNKKQHTHTGHFSRSMVPSQLPSFPHLSELSDNCFFVLSTGCLLWKNGVESLGRMGLNMLTLTCPEPGLSLRM